MGIIEKQISNEQLDPEYISALKSTSEQTLLSLESEKQAHLKAVQEKKELEVSLILIHFYIYLAPGGR